MKSQIGVVQMNSSDRLVDNVAFAKAQIEQAADQGIDLVSFPETFVYVGQNHHEKHQVAQTLDGELVQTFRDLANQHDLSILLGSIYEKTPDDDSRLYNTSILINRQGELNGVYRKIHMCDAPTLGYNESVGIKPGNIPVVVEHEIGMLGLSVCYDLRFPELYRHLTEKGAEVIFVPSAFFLYTGKHHWLPLLTARAIENQVYIVAPNQWGKHHEGRTSYGSSVIIDPWGSVICCAPERPGMVSATLDLGYLREVRSNMPILGHRRPEIYQSS
jgi:predicted amidohydrolase